MRRSIVAPQWERIDRDEYLRLIAEAGGIEALTVFSTLTDPDGVYGSPRIYTAWGLRDSDVPLVDHTDERDYEGRTEQTIYRKFVGEEWL